jgi:hypothetical protein
MTNTLLGSDRDATVFGGTLTQSTMLQNNCLEFETKALLETRSGDTKVFFGDHVLNSSGVKLTDTSGAHDEAGTFGSGEKGAGAQALYLNPGGTSSQSSNTAKNDGTLVNMGFCKVLRAMEVLEGLTLCRDTDDSEGTLRMRGQKISYESTAGTTTTYTNPATIVFNDNTNSDKVVMTLKTYNGDAADGVAGAGTDAKGAKFEQKNTDAAAGNGVNVLTAHTNKLENGNNYLKLVGDALSSVCDSVTLDSAGVNAVSGSSNALTADSSNNTLTAAEGTNALVAPGSSGKNTITAAHDNGVNTMVAGLSNTLTAGTAGTAGEGGVRGVNILAANSDIADSGNRLDATGTNGTNTIDATVSNIFQADLNQLKNGSNYLQLKGSVLKSVVGTCNLQASGTTSIHTGATTGNGSLVFSAGNTITAATDPAAELKAYMLMKNTDIVTPAAGQYTHYGTVHIKDTGGGSKGNLQVDGNLTVNGTTTTVNTTQTTIADKEIVINRAGADGDSTASNVAAHGDFAGLRVERGPDRQDLLMRFNWSGHLDTATDPQGNLTSLQNGINGTNDTEATPTVRFTRAVANGTNDANQDASGAVAGGQAPGAADQTYDIGIVCKHLVTSSDARWKHNIKPVRNSKDIIDKMRPVYWDWNGENTASECGLIAQHVKKIAPDAVRGSEREGYGLNYNYFIGLLMARVKELTKEVESIKR